MKRRFINGLLCLGILMFAAPKANAMENPQIQLMGTEVKVSGKAEKEQSVTFIVLHSGYDDINHDDKGKKYDADNIKDIYYNVSETTADESGEYEFTYTMRDNDKSGSYTVWIGGKDGESVSTQYYYASRNDRDEIINLINAAKTEDEMIKIFLNEERTKVINAMGFNVKRYNALSDSSKYKIMNVLIGKNYSGDDAEKKAAEDFNTSTAIQSINEAKTSKEAEEKLTENNDVLKIECLESSEYKNLSDDEKDVMFAALVKREAFRSKTELELAVKEDMQIPLINRLSYGEFRDFIYKNNSVLKFDLTKYEALNENQKAQAAKKMTEIKFTSIAEIRKKYTEACSVSTPNPPSGGGGGQGSSGGGNTIVGNTGTNEVKNQRYTFSDMNEAQWAEEYVTSLYEKNILSGDGDGKFRPNSNITREEFIKLVMEAFGFEKSTETEFDDVDEKAWYAAYVGGAVKNNIINGISDNRFGVGENITRQDMAVIIYRVLTGIDVELKNTYEYTFADSGDISDYAVEAIKSLSGAGIINGVGNAEFKPLGNSTRAQACSVIYKALLLLDK